MSDFDVLLKFILIGESSVGKSSIMMQYADGKYVKDYMSTVGVDFKFKTIDHESKRVKIQIWDTAGQERFRTITQTYYRGSHGMIVVYDVTDRSSFDKVNYWIQEVIRNTNNIPIAIVANKIDLIDKRVITTEEGEFCADLNNAVYFETSALNGENIEQLFKELVSESLDLNKFSNEKTNNNEKLHNSVVLYDSEFPSEFKEMLSPKQNTTCCQ
jgi:Ras-related protein Rab-1A